MMYSFDYIASLKIFLNYILTISNSFIKIEKHFVTLQKYNANNKNQSLTKINHK